MSAMAECYQEQALTVVVIRSLRLSISGLVGEQLPMYRRKASRGKKGTTCMPKNDRSHQNSQRGLTARSPIAVRLQVRHSASVLSQAGISILSANLCAPLLFKFPLRPYVLISAFHLRVPIDRMFT
jgi:hypothetical protein